MSMKSKSKRVKIDTLGCKLNQAETELMAEQFVKAGYRLTASIDKADVYVLNTCTVTHIADRKSRHLLRMARRRNAETVIVAIGCYAQRTRQELADIDGINMVLENDKKMNIVQLLEAEGRLSVPDCNRGDLKAEHESGTRNRAFVKAQDGCNNCCTYCIVPVVRGREESLPAEDIITRIGDRIIRGYKEVVLTGTEIGSYSYNGIDLSGLVEKILDETDIVRLRLSSLQPHHITPQLMQLWRDTRLCPHLHLSLQSGSDSVLRRMGRHYSGKEYNEAVSLIRSLIPEAAITTDIIVGFPGESDDEFEESYRFCKDMEFARIHVFTFSPRPGTQAAEMKEQVSSIVKKERSREMLALAEESAGDFRKRFMGRTMPVLWEQKTNNIWSGLSANYIRVYTKSNEDLSNKITEVKLEKLYKDGVWGK